MMHWSQNEDEIRTRLEAIGSAAGSCSIGENSTVALDPVFGVYLPGLGEQDMGDMLKKAVTARMEGPADKTIRFYDGDLPKRLLQEREMADALVDALHKNEFVVYYQPKIRLSDAQVTGAEALIRWRHPQRGLLSPEMFLPQAEKYQIITQIDELVFEELCRTLAGWKAQQKEICPLSINLSRTDVERPDLPDTYYEICRRHEVSPYDLEFEIPEPLLAEIPDAVQTLIERLHAYGFRCAADDFSASWFPLQSLCMLDFDTLKLDRSFFSGGNNSRQGRYILENILRLAAQLQIRTVAEGVESLPQIRYLQQAACDAVQGFYYFKPMPLDRLEEQIYVGRELKCVAAEAQSETVQYEPASADQSGQSFKNIVLFSYWPSDDTAEFSYAFSPVLEGKTFFKNASALFRTTNLVHENDKKDFFQLLERCQRENGWVENLLRFYVSDDRYAWLELRMRMDRHGDDTRISGLMVNMEGWRNEVNRWKEKATRDVLTGLYNREYFEQHVRSALDRGTCTSAAVLFIDVDDLKRANDTHGHLFADDILCYMAKLFLSTFRHTDVVARYGGDEFVVFVPSIEREVLAKRLEKLFDALQYPYRNDTVQYRVSGSIGVAMYPDDGADYETLLRHADSALYEAKENGKGRYVMYEPYMCGTNNSLGLD